MNKKKIMRLRCKLTCVMCKGKYRRFSKKLLNYVENNYLLEENICSNLEDIWAMLVDNCSRNIEFSDVIKDEALFMKDAFSSYPEVNKPNYKFIFYLFLFVVLIPGFIGLIIYLQLTKF